MPTLNLGVLDVAYSDPDTKGANTTGEVAEILEAKYHIMRIFVEDNEDFINEVIADEMAGAIEALAQGATVVEFGSPLMLDKLEERFKDFITNEEMKAITGKNTAAAEDRATLRRKMKKGPERPAFVDTGLYRDSFKSWVDL